MNGDGGFSLDGKYLYIGPDIFCDNIMNRNVRRKAAIKANNIV